MREKKGQCKRILREASAVALALALLAPVLVGQGRRGAQLVVTKNDGTIVRGELLAVKGTDLLIIDKSAAGGVSVSLADAKLVKVVNPGRVTWILTGALAGGAVGVALGASTGLGGETMGPVGGGIGILTGCVVGLVVGANKKFPIVDSDPNSLNLIASRLRKLAKDKS